VPSPCVSICSLDAQDLCTGCWRSAEEIARWNLLDDEERRRVLARTRARMQAAGVLFD
jgi:predicted Fe-S protein YdhL (DUF1289 family)